MIPYTQEELQKILFSAVEYPISFPDTIGLDIEDELSHTALRIHHPDGTRHVTLTIDSFLDSQYSTAHHVYGQLTIDGVTRVMDYSDCVATADAGTGIYKNPLAAQKYVIFLKRRLIKADMKEKDGWGNPRWEGYKIGEYVMPFRTSRELIRCAKRIFQQCFTGNWSLWMEDKTGPGVVRTLLAPRRLKKYEKERMDYQTLEKGSKNRKTKLAGGIRNKKK